MAPAPPSDSTPIGPLLLTVFGSILQVFLQCAAGWLLAKQGILDKKTQKKINRLNVSLFTPALLFSKVAFFLSPTKLRQLWIIPIFFCVVTAVSMTVSWLLGRVFRLKKSQRSFAMAAAMFMNSNSLPIALMQSLVGTVKGLRWAKDDTRNEMLGRALTYLVLYSTLGMMFRWSFGVHLLAQADDEVTQPEEEEETAPNERTPLLREGTSGHIRSQPSITFSSYDGEGNGTPPQEILSGSEDDLSPNLTMTNPPPTTTGYAATGTTPSAAAATRVTSDPSKLSVQPKSHFYYSFPNTPRYSVASLPNEGDGDADNDVNSCDSSITARPRPNILRRTWTKINSFMTMPLWAALASIVVACIQPLQHLLMVHMLPVKGALAAAGDCSIPLTLIVLGGYFHSEEDNGGDQVEEPSSALTSPGLPQVSNAAGRDLGPEHRMNSELTLVESVRSMFTHRRGKAKRKTHPGETRTVFVAILSRMFLTPAILLPIFALLIFSEGHDVFDDPIFIVSSVLLVASPPALTLAQITQAASGDAFERLISKTIFWSYCIVTPITTIIYVVIGLVFSKI